MNITITKPIKCWHFAPGELIAHGHYYAGIGVDEPEVENICLCYRGYHGSKNPVDALGYNFINGIRAEYIELSGDIDYGEDKLVASKRKCIGRLCSKCTEEVLVETTKELGIPEYNHFGVTLGAWAFENFTNEDEKKARRIFTRNLKKKMKIK